MSIQYNKLFGLSRFTFEAVNTIMIIGIGAKFTLELPYGRQASISLVKVPVNKRGTPANDYYVVSDKLYLGSTHDYHDLLECYPALRVEISDINMPVDWEALNSAKPEIKRQAQERLDLAVEALIPETLSILTRFYTAYREAKFDIDSKIGRSIDETINVTRRMPDWEFRMYSYYCLTEGSNEARGWLAGSKSAHWPSEEEQRQLWTLVQDYLSKGADFARSRVIEAQQNLYDGELPIAVVNSVISLESALTNFVQTQWQIRGVSKSRIDEVEKDITLSLMLNIELQALAPEGMKPDTQLIGKLNSARKLRNKIVHNRKTDVTYEQAKESVESVNVLLQYLKSL